MNRKKKWKRFWTLDVHNHEGFTLVELIIVIAILAILSAVAVAGYSAYIKKANETADKATLAQLNSAFAAACAINGEDNFLRTDGPYLTGSGNTVNGLAFTTASETNAKIAEEFGASMGSSVTFKVYEVSKLTYNSKTGTFELGNLNTDQKKIDAFKNSAFADMYMDELMGQMDSVIEYATGRFDGTDLLAQIKDEPKFIEFCQMFDKNYPYDETVEGNAAKNLNVQMQALVLYCSEEAVDLDVDALYEQIVNHPGAYIGVSIDGEWDTDAEAFAANGVMYSLGLAFAQSEAGGKVINNPLFVEELKTECGTDVFMETEPDHIIFLMRFMDAPLDDAGDPIESQRYNPFQKWLQDDPDAAKTNIAGFQGAMGMITDNQDNLDYDKILEDGYGADEDLIAELERLLGNG